MAILALLAVLVLIGCVAAAVLALPAALAERQAAPADTVPSPRPAPTRRSRPSRRDTPDGLRAVRALLAEQRLRDQAA